MKVQHKAHGLAVKGSVVAAEAAVQHGQREHIYQVPPVSRTLMKAVQPAHDCQHLMPGSIVLSISIATQALLLADESIQGLHYGLSMQEHECV